MRGWEDGLKPGLRAGCGMALLAAAVVSLAEKPTLDHVFPTAVARGTTNSVTLSGKFEAWPPKIWSSVEGLNFVFSTNKGSVQVVVDEAAPVGAGLARLFNDDGASELAILAVTADAWVADSEPNNHFSKPQHLTHFPAAINGRLEKNNDVDSFGFSVRAGQWIEARVESHTLMSKLDAVLRLVTTHGYQVAWNHDFDTFDPRLVWRAPKDETVVLQVFGFVYPAGSEIALSGGNGGVYQLRVALTDQPPAELSGPLMEEPSTNALPVERMGAICPAGDEDRFYVALKKDETVEIVVNASEFGSPLDPWVRIDDAAGKELARNDDADGTRDARLEWKAPMDGEYAAVVGSLTHQGAEDWRYRFAARKVGPEYKATVASNAILLMGTGTNELKVGTQRLRNFTNELVVAIQNLPEGVTVEPAKVDGKSSEATLRLVAENAPPFNGPVRVTVADLATKEERAAFFELVSRSENNGVPGGYSKLMVERTDTIWLTVKAQPAGSK